MSGARRSQPHAATATLPVSRPATSPGAPADLPAAAGAARLSAPFVPRPRTTLEPSSTHAVTADTVAEDLCDLDDQGSPDQGYRSPLMSRLSGTGRLTLDNLRRDVPLLHAATAASARLARSDQEPLTDEEALALRRDQRAGEDAKERLMLAAIPLIKHLAQKEHTRRQNWQSQVAYDDLFQEGMIGLFLGLDKYDPNGTQTSPTNYLGQWVLATMRRNTETIDNDFGVAFDAAERFRRIRALRSRLTGEWGREPTDAEMIAAWADPAYLGARKIGRLKKTKPPKPLTVAQLDEERALRRRVGHTSRLSSGASDEGEAPVIESARPLGEATLMHQDAAEDAIAAGMQQGLSRLLAQTMNALTLPATQREIIARRWGLSPHPREESARDISAAMGLHRERVGKVIDAFTTEMSRPGGAFHRACSALSTEELADLHLGWVSATLGDYPRVIAGEPGIPDILLADLTPRQRASASSGPSVQPLTTTTTDSPAAAAPGVPAARRGVMTAQGTVSATYRCNAHATDFVGIYPTFDAVPTGRACPRCGRPSALVAPSAA